MKYIPGRKIHFRGEGQKKISGTFLLAHVSVGKMLDDLLRPREKYWTKPPSRFFPRTFYTRFNSPPQVVCNPTRKDNQHSSLSDSLQIQLVAFIRMSPPLSTPLTLSAPVPRLIISDILGLGQLRSRTGSLMRSTNT